MAENTKIQWCHHTFNPWRGCQKVSPGCANCYAEELSKRNPKVLGEWGPQGKRAIAAEAYWREPLKWNKQALAAGERRRVFCASLADVFEDRPELVAPRSRLFALIEQTPQLDWLLLTKRPESWSKCLHDCWQHLDALSETMGPMDLTRQWIDCWQEGDAPANVWFGVSVEDQLRLRRVYDLGHIPAAVRFLSCQPLLSPLDFMDGPLDGNSTMGDWSLLDGVDWVIVGGESGSHARPCHVDWIRGVVRQCRAAGVPVYVKQLGSAPRPGPLPSDVVVRVIRDLKGGDMEEWPEDLRIREFPIVRSAPC